MINRARKIVVDNAEYYWSVKEGDWYEAILSVFREKELIFRRTYELTIITPVVVEEAIRTFQVG